MAGDLRAGRHHEEFIPAAEESSTTRVFRSRQSGWAASGLVGVPVSVVGLATTVAGPACREGRADGRANRSVRA